MADIDAQVILPDFIVIGAMKSGTTSLYRTLSRHPRIGMSRDKETDFFLEERNFRHGVKWYADQFTPGFDIYGEASPNYTKVDDFKGVPERIQQLCPSVKLLYIVRDPVDRFISQYRHSWTMGDVAYGPEELPGTHEYQHILGTSSYARQLQAYLDIFPADQIKVVDFDELTASGSDILGDVLDFIGAPRADLTEIGNHNDNAEISRIPAPILRLAQSPVGRMMNRLVSREQRDQIRGLLARGKTRQPPTFPATLRNRIAADLKDDVAAFRKLTGQRFAGWSV